MSCPKSRKIVPVLAALVVCLAACSESNIEPKVKPKVEPKIKAKVEPKVDVADLTYEVSGFSVSITDCKETAVGALVIPVTFEGKPVTSIGGTAFFNCTNLIDNL